MKYNQLVASDILDFHQILDLLPAAIYTTDNDGLITNFNNAAADLWGRKPEIGKDLWCGSWKIFTPDGSPMELDTCPMAVALKEKRQVNGVEIMIQKPDGQMRNVLPNPRPIFDGSGQMVGAVNLLIDITETKKTENKLRERENELEKLNASLEKKVEERMNELVLRNADLRRSEEKYHKMIDEVEDYAIIMLDKEGNILNWNRGVEKIKGYKEIEIVGRNFREFYLPADREAKFPERLLNEAATKGKVFHEGWRVRKNGTTFWGSVVITALHDSQNNIIGYSKVTRDLTERKLAEDKLREYTIQLEFQNRELDQFAYAASHDMKEPLRKISYYNTYIIENSGESLNDKTRDYLNRSIRAVKKMQTLIDDLLMYTKTTFSIKNFEDVDLNECMEEIIFINKDLFEEKNIRLELEPLPVVKGISFQLKQLLDNLIGNAIRYKHPLRNGLIQVYSTEVSGKMIDSEEIDKDLNYHSIVIKDNGVGFDSMYSEKIFEIFQRLTSSSESSGSGIGLAMCKKIIQNHNGHIIAAGVPDEGAIFTFYLPVL